MPRTVSPPTEPLDDELPRAGDLIDGKYRVEEVIGQGGMGVVVAARHEVMGQEVAIKLLRGQSVAWESVARFMREARASAQLRSAHVARVYDCGTLDSGAPFLVMERLVGHDLKVERSRRGVLPPDEAVDLMLQAMVGLAEAHARGIIHRDLKPSNLFLADKPGGGAVVKVLDFGVSKLTAVERVEDDLTETAALLGSPRYMSPEQATRPRAVDQRSDIWSLGVILYELLTGVVPFDGDTLGEVIGKLLVEPVAPVHQLRPEVPRELSAAVDACLQRELASRTSSLVALANALAPWATARGHEAVRQIDSLLSDATTPPPLSEERSASRQPESERAEEATLAASRGAASDHTQLAAETRVLPPRRGRRGLSLALSLASLGVVAVVASLSLGGEPRRLERGLAPALLRHRISLPSPPTAVTTLQQPAASTASSASASAVPTVRPSARRPAPRLRPPRPRVSSDDVLMDRE